MDIQIKRRPKQGLNGRPVYQVISGDEAIGLVFRSSRIHRRDWAAAPYAGSGIYSMLDSQRFRTRAEAVDALVQAMNGASS